MRGFRIFEPDEFLVNLARRGTYVRRITEHDIRNNFPIKAYLESLAAQLAVDNLTKKDMQSARSKMEEAGKVNDFIS